MSDPRTTVVVCTIGDELNLAACLAALQCQDDDDHEILVVDNTEGRDAVQQIAGRAGARYVVEPRRGLSRARNAGAHAARGQLVAYIDDDAVPDPAWLRLLVAPFADPAVGATTGRILPVDADADPFGLGLGATARRVERGTPGWFEIANFGGIGAGSSMAFRRGVVTFREDLGLGTAIEGSEEHNAFFAVVRAGHAIQYVPESVVRHHEPGSESSDRRRRILRSGGAYLAMLIAEEPGFRRPALRYAVTSVWGKRRAWRGPVGTTVRSRTPERVVHALAGVALYLRYRVKRARLGAAP
jgi:cellulose synthase/poly-beta-1,6-N-acetylglucosamine synthase-like glycosyltransferase